MYYGDYKVILCGTMRIRPKWYDILRWLKLRKRKMIPVIPTQEVWKNEEDKILYVGPVIYNLLKRELE